MFKKHKELYTADEISVFESYLAELKMHCAKSLLDFNRMTRIIKNDMKLSDDMKLDDEEIKKQKNIITTELIKLRYPSIIPIIYETFVFISILRKVQSDWAFGVHDYNGTYYRLIGENLSFYKLREDYEKTSDLVTTIIKIVKEFLNNENSKNLKDFLLSHFDTVFSRSFLKHISEIDIREAIIRRKALPDSLIDKDVILREGDENHIMKNTVFIIHGHDKNVLSHLEKTLYAIGVTPLIFDRAEKRGSETIIEILSRILNQVDAIIALLTPDEKVILEDDDSSFYYRARPNVYIEAGYAILSNRQRSLILSIGDIDIPTDFAGIHRVQDKKWSDSTAIKTAKRLKDMGLDVDISKIYS